MQYAMGRFAGSNSDGWMQLLLHTSVSLNCKQIYYDLFNHYSSQCKFAFIWLFKFYRLQLHNYVGSLFLTIFAPFEVWWEFFSFSRYWRLSWEICKHHCIFWCSYFCLINLVNSTWWIYMSDSAFEVWGRQDCCQDFCLLWFPYVCLRHMWRVRRISVCNHVIIKETLTGGNKLTGWVVNKVWESQKTKQNPSQIAPLGRGGFGTRYLILALYSG